MTTSAVKNYYDQRGIVEWERLDRYRMEYEVTKKIFTKYIPRQRQKICDIGGGPGKYSIHLSKLGHSVTLIDLSPKQIEIARQKATYHKVKLEKYIVADATNIPELEDEMFDVVLLMGPLYHLLKEEQITQALNEATRTLKKGGLLFSSFINTYERLRMMASCCPEDIQNNKRLVKEIIATGKMEQPLNLQNHSSVFTQVAFTQPQEIEKRMQQANITKIALHGLEPINGRPYDAAMNCSDRAWAEWVDLNYALSTKQELLGSSDHYLYVGKK